MVENERERARNRDTDAERIERVGHELENELAAERSNLSRLTEVGRALRFADFMALLMVAATAFSAYAAWRTAKVTNLVFAISDRPFLGVENVALEATDSPQPRVAVDYRNFGRIPALDSLVSVHALIDGKPVHAAPDEMSTIDTGIVSPNVPHFFYLYLPADAVKAVSSGQSKMQLHVRMLYKGPGLERQYCYFERIIFDHRSASFRLGGGSDHCGGGEVF